MSSPVPPPGGPAPKGPLPPAGWYPDPTDGRLSRYWNGSQWGAATAPLNAITRKVGLGQAVALAFRGAFTYRGRSTAGEFWWFVLFNFLVTGALYIVIIAATPSDPYARSATPVIAGLASMVLFLWFFVSLIVQIPLTVRRLHDKDMTGWLTILAFLPIAALILAILLIGSGTPGPNRYGPVPA